MLIDDFLPEYDFEEKHGIAIRASAAKVYSVLNEIDFSESALVRWLLRLRGMSGSDVTLRSLERSKFEKLGEIANKEFLIGLAGRFWTPWGDLQAISSSTFREFNTAGFAKAAWNFSLDESDGGTRLETETRIKCLDTDSRRSFGFYWTFVGPFSGLIRMEMLKTVKRHAEAGEIGAT